jgi:hypothetical protein
MWRGLSRVTEIELGRQASAPPDLAEDSLERIVYSDVPQCSSGKA